MTSYPETRTQFSPKTIENLLSDNKEWHNIQDIVRTSFQTLCSIVASQGHAISELQKALNSNPTKSEVQTALSSKVEMSDFISSINDINSSLTLRPHIDDITAMNEDKVSKTEFKTLLSTKLSIDDAKLILDKKSDAIETNQQYINLHREIENLKKDLNQKISLCASIKDISKISSQISQKVSIYDLDQIISTRVSKEEMVNALRNKANKIEVDQLLKSKIDVNEINEIISILNSKASNDDMEKCFNMINSKLDKTSLNFIKEMINSKVDLKEFDTFINSYNEKSSIIQKKVDDIDHDFDNLISNIKSQFSSVNTVITNIDKNKIDIKQLEAINYELSKRINEGTFNGMINQIKFDLNDMIDEAKKEIKLNNNTVESFINSKFEMEKTDIETKISITNKNSDLQNESIKKLCTNYDEIKKQLFDFNSKLTFVSGDSNSKFNSLIEILKSKLEKKDYEVNNSKFENEIRLFYQDMLSTKASYNDLDNLYQKIQDNITTKTNQIHNSIVSEIKQLASKLNEISNNAIIKESLDKEMKKQNNDIANLLNQKVSTEQFENLKQAVDKIIKELVNKTDYTKFHSLSSNFTMFSSDTKAQLDTKVSSNEIVDLLKDKVSIKEIKKLSEELENSINQKVNKENYAKMLSNQAAINDLLCKENVCGKWTWKSGKLKNGYSIPWEEQITNSMIDNFYWEKDKSSLMIALSGLYSITFGLFSKDIPAIVHLIINGEKICTAETKAIKNESIEKRDIDITDVYINEFISIPDRARISFEIRDTQNKLFYGEKVESFLIIKKI